MKKRSEELKHQAACEENDLKAMGILNKALREKRNESFEEKWLEKLTKNENVKEVIFHDNSAKYLIVTEKFGTIDFFPKANNLLIRKDNKWKKPGLNWLIKNLKL